ncbi:MAG: F0F1 ATP synthase subunit delta [Treponema sp.]|nr:F0F1 ATP synthase subunit delta [Treponema sp.]
MFHTNRWAAAFVALAGEDARALACLNALVPPVKAISGALFGHAASRQLEMLLKESAEAAGFSGTGAQYAIRFIALLVEKNRFGHIDSILLAIEEMFDRQSGVPDVILESAAPLDGAFREEAARRIAALYGTEKINLKTRLIPELLGGYRLRSGGFYIDASLRGQIEELKSGLEAAYITPSAGV